jgi:acyl-CoA synthetase (AMP-forming)/AMP-acid ligase II
MSASAAPTGSIFPPWMASTSTLPGMVPAKTDGYFWVMGRVDDVINVSGHRLGTMEIESALVSHPAVAEAAVVGRKDEVKGEDIFAFVTLEGQYSPSDDLKKELKQHVVQEIGASLPGPEKFSFADALPKTRSGKIIRRFLRNLSQRRRYCRRCLHHGRPECAGTVAGRVTPIAAGILLLLGVETIVSTPFCIAG